MEPRETSIALSYSSISLPRESLTIDNVVSILLTSESGVRASIAFVMSNWESPVLLSILTPIFSNNFFTPPSPESESITASVES